MTSIDLGDQVVPIENTQRLRNGDDNRDVARLARSARGKRAAQFATANILSSFLENGTPSAQAKAAEVLQEIAHDLEGAPVTQPHPEAVLPATAHAEPAPEPVVAVTDYELPADLEALLEEPEEFAYDDEPEPVADEVAVDDDEYVDPQVAKLRRELERERKKTEHERKLRVQTARKDWEAEAARVFSLGAVPLLDTAELQSIKAESKREFMRQAKTLADRNKTVAQRFQPATAAAPAVPREQTAEVWGTPPAATSPASADSVAHQDRLAKARRSGNLSAIFKAQMFPDAND